MTDEIVIHLGEDNSFEEDNTSFTSATEDESSAERKSNDGVEAVEPLHLSGE